MDKIYKQNNFDKKETDYEEKDKFDFDDHGVVFVSGEIELNMANKVIESIIRMNIENKVNFIQMIINSQGGDIYSGFAIIDIMEWSKIPVYTTGLGIIASMALMILMNGEKGYRTVSQNTSILSHRFFTRMQGNYSELLASRIEEDRIHKKILEQYKKCTNLTKKEEIEKFLLKDVDIWLTPKEAKDFGIVDRYDIKDFDTGDKNG